MMKKHSSKNRVLAFLTAVTALAGGIAAPCSEAGFNAVKPESITANAASTGNRILVDLNKNDGRKASYARNATNWIIDSDSSISKTINGVTFTLTAGGGSLRGENNKKLQKMSGIYSYLTMDGATVDTTSGGTLTLKISGLSNGTHSLKTYHSATGNESVSGISVSASGGTSMSGISCPNQVLTPDDAGLGYVTFTGTSTTVTIKASSGNAWLNAFELDGGDPINGVNHVSPADQEAHLLRENGLSWTAGKNAASHNVYIGTDYDSVFNATTSSSEFKGNQTGTTYALDETYQSVNAYYWRVDTVDSSGNVIKGSVNSFNVARLAFPTAEGYGRFARGGQGGVVVHVTNLKDDGSEGSLRWALCDEQWQTDDWKGVPRIIVFDVGGVITLTDTLCIPDNAGQVYVAGQTAPGDGITLTTYDFGAMGSTDVIIRDVRVRVGDDNGSSHGGMGLSSCNHTIVDHCSISWATDEGFSSRQAQNITFQWNIIGESLHDSVHYNGDDRTQTETHAFAASIGGYTGSYHHNLLINCTGRNWSLAGAMEQDAVTYGGQADIRNNVVYNWKDRTTDGGVRRLNFVNNYYKAGAESNTNLHVVSTDGNELNTSDMQKMYVSGNVMTKTDGTYILKSTDNAWDKGKAVSGGKNSTAADVRSDTPFFESYVNTQSAEDAYNSILAGAGAGGTSTTGWDYIDSRYIKEAKNGTYTYTGSKQGLKGIIDSESDAGGYPNSSNFTHSNDGVCNSTNDTDRDGMPNSWETEHGLDPSDGSDGSIVSLSAEGYTNVEMFLNELCGDDVVYGEPVASGKKGAVMDTEVTYVFENVGSGLFLEVENSTAKEGTDVVQSTAGAAGWKLEDAGNGYYKVYSEVGDGKTYLLDLSMGDVANGTNIGIWTDTACDAQSFKFVKNSDGSYTICTKATADESCIGIASGSKDSGATAVQWAADGSDNQKWIAKIRVQGDLIDEILLSENSYYSSWSIDSSLDVGDQVFGDRVDDKLVTYATIPDELLGAETVLTACDDKATEGTVAELTVSEDVDIYVGLDHRVTTVPSWLDGFEATGLTAVNSKDVVFDLYKLECSAGDTVTLGANGQSSGCVNYTVFAVKAEEPTTPEPTTEPTTVPETTAPDTERVWGDANCDGDVLVNDVVLVMSYAASPESSQITAEGLANSDVYQTGDGVAITDAASIQKFLTKNIASLPEV